MRRSLVLIFSIILFLLRACQSNMIRISLIIDDETIIVQFNEKGNTLESIEIPIKEGYIFSGWYDNISSTTKIDAFTLLQNDMTIYADWSSDGIEFAYDDVNNGYVVSKGTFNQNVLYIPKIYNNKHVIGVKDNTFILSEIKKIDKYTYNR